MKVKMLPLAVAAAIAAPGVALAETNFYGKIDVAYGMSKYDYGYDQSWNSTAADFVDLDETTADRWDLSSYDSRFGVKGEEKISDNLSAIYLIEWEVSIDGDKADMGQRNRYVGLKGGWGQLIAGRADTPLKSAQGKIDLFGDRTGDLKYVLVGETRASNVVQYTTPAMGGFVANLAIIPGEEYDTGQDDAKSGPADHISISAVFNMDNLYLAVARDSDVSGTYYYGVKPTLDGTGSLESGSVGFDTTRLVAVFNMDAFQVGAMYQMAETADTDVDPDLEQSGFLLSGSFKLNDLVLKAQYGASTLTFNDVTGVKFAGTVYDVNVDPGNALDEDNDAELIALGADYILSKQTNLFAHYTTVSYEFSGDGAESQSFDRIEVGILHNF